MTLEIGLKYVMEICRLLNDKNEKVVNYIMSYPLHLLGFSFRMGISHLG